MCCALRFAVICPQSRTNALRLHHTPVKPPEKRQECAWICSGRFQAVTLSSCVRADLHQAMQKAMQRVGMPLEQGPASPHDFARGAAAEAAALRAQVQQLQAELAAAQAAR